MQSASSSRLTVDHETRSEAENRAMQAANGNRRGVHIYGRMPDGRPFLPQMHGARRLRPRGLAKLGNHGSGRIQSFVGALLLALPLLLTLHALDAEPPMTDRSHQLTRRFPRDNSRTFYPFPMSFTPARAPFISLMSLSIRSRIPSSRAALIGSPIVRRLCMSW